MSGVVITGVALSASADAGSLPGAAPTCDLGACASLSGVAFAVFDVAAEPFVVESVESAESADPVFDVAAEPLAVEVAALVFDVVAVPVGVDFADPVFDVVAEPVDVEVADDELSSDDGAAAAMGVGLLAKAIPSPSATVAAAARVVNFADFIESSDCGGDCPGLLRGSHPFVAFRPRQLQVSPSLLSRSWQVIRLTDARRSHCPAR